jgi:hypothetical protein
MLAFEDLQSQLQPSMVQYDTYQDLLSCSKFYILCFFYCCYGKNIDKFWFYKKKQETRDKPMKKKSLLTATAIE